MPVARDPCENVRTHHAQPSLRFESQHMNQARTRVAFDEDFGPACSKLRAVCATASRSVVKTDSASAQGTPSDKTGGYLNTSLQDCSVE